MDAPLYALELQGTAAGAFHAAPGSANPNKSGASDAEKAGSGRSGRSSYYDAEGVTIYHGDCREIVPQLARFDLLLTDPPYGINQCKGMGGGGYDSTGKYPRKPRKYEGGWDDEAPSPETIAMLLASAKQSIIWGGNYFSGRLPKGNKWLVWDKEQVMPTYSDAEMAFTSLPGDSVKMFRYGVNKHRAEEEREHPTQKPLVLMQWCIQLAGDVATILDPFAGSGTTGQAAKNLGKRCVLIEREERFCEIAARRLSQSVLSLGGGGAEPVTEAVCDNPKSQNDKMRGGTL